MSETSTISGAISRARERLLWTIGHVPDDKLNWSPAPSAHTTLQIAAHLVSSNGFFTGAINGNPTAALGEADPVFSGREEAVAAINASFDALIAAVDALPAERMEAPVPTPMGESTIGFFVRLTPAHTFMHCGQIEYIQACYGDTDFHWND